MVFFSEFFTCIQQGVTTDNSHHQKPTFDIHIMERCNIYRQLAEAMIQGVRHYVSNSS